MEKLRLIAGRTGSFGKGLKCSGRATEKSPLIRKEVISFLQAAKKNSPSGSEPQPLFRRKEGSKSPLTAKRLRALSEGGETTVPVRIGYGFVQKEKRKGGTVPAHLVAQE